MSAAAGAHAAAAARNRSYWPLVPSVASLTVIVTAVNFLAPLLLLLSNDLGVTVPEVGQLVVFTALSWAAAALLTGLISDRFGRRPVIITALAGMGVCTILGAFATEFWMLLVLRLVTGIFGSGGPPTIMAGLVDYYPPHQRGKAIGWVNTTFSLGALIGVPAAGWAGGEWGWRVSFVIVGGALIFSALAIAVFFPRVRPGGRGAGHPVQAYGHLIRLPHMATFLSANFFERVTFMVMALYFASFLMQNYLLNAKTVAPFLALVAAGAFVGALSGGFLADRLNRIGLAALMLGLSAVFGLATFVWPGVLALSLAAGLGFGFTNAASRPPFMSLLLGLSDQHRGALNGLISTSNQVGWAVGAGAGGLVLGLAGYSGLGLLILVLGVASSGLLLLTRSVLRQPVARPRPGSASPPRPAARPVPGGDPRAASAWPVEALAAEVDAAQVFGGWADRTADPELAETLALAAARARDRAFRLRRATNAVWPAGRLPANGAADRPDVAAGAPDRAPVAGDLDLLDRALNHPSLYADPSARVADPVLAALLPTLRENEAETRALLAEQRDRLRLGGQTAVVRTLAAEAIVRGDGILRQAIRGSGDAVPLLRIAQPPGATQAIAPRGGPVYLLPLSGRGICRPERGADTPLPAGRLIEIATAAPTAIITTGDWPLTYLILGEVDLPPGETAGAAPVLVTPQDGSRIS